MLGRLVLKTKILTTGSAPRTLRMADEPTFVKYLKVTWSNGDIDDPTPSISGDIAGEHFPLNEDLVIDVDTYRRVGVDLSELYVTIYPGQEVALLYLEEQAHG